MTAGRERDDLLTLALAFAVVPLTWWLLLGWSGPRAIAGHDELASLHNLLSIREIVETGEGWRALVYRPDVLGGFKGRDTAGAFPLFSLLAATGLGPTAISVWSAFIVQALLAFLGCRAAADLTALGDGPPRDLTPIGRIGVIWLCGFAPVLAWRLAFGHLNLVVGLLPFAAALALVAAAAARTLTLSLGGVSAAAFVLGLLHAGQQIVVYGAVFGAPIMLGLWLSRGGPWRRLHSPVLITIGAFLVALPAFWGVLAHARGSDAARPLGTAIVTYDFVTSTVGDWLTSLPWTRALAGTRTRAVTAPRGELSDRSAGGAAGAPAVAPGSRARDRPGHRRGGGDRPEHGPDAALARVARVDPSPAQLPGPRPGGAAADLGALHPVSGGAHPMGPHRDACTGFCAAFDSPPSQGQNRTAPADGDSVARASRVARHSPRDPPLRGTPHAPRRGRPRAGRRGRDGAVARWHGARRDDSARARRMQRLGIPRAPAALPRAAPPLRRGGQPRRRRPEDQARARLHPESRAAGSRDPCLHGELRVRRRTRQPGRLRRADRAILPPRLRASRRSLPAHRKLLQAPRQRSRLLHPATALQRRLERDASPPAAVSPSPRSAQPPAPPGSAPRQLASTT